jgi:hypothetical protein
VKGTHKLEGEPPFVAVTMAGDPEKPSSMQRVSNLMDQRKFNRISRALRDPRRMEIFERIGKEDEAAGASVNVTRKNYL